MSKSIKDIVSRISSTGDGQMTGGFGSIRGGSGAVYSINTGDCSNSSCVNSTNNGNCTNSSNCTGATNQGPKCAKK